jgi:hypothetical protein
MTLHVEPGPSSSPLSQHRERPSQPREPRLVVEQARDGRLWARRGEQAAPVRVVRSFPWSAPDRYLSLRTTDDEEFALVADLASLDAASRRALEQALTEAGFVFVIERILEIEEDFELRCWNVETSHGPRRLQTALDSWPRDTPGGGILVEDVGGDLFVIPKPEALDAKSQELLWALVD